MLLSNKLTYCITTLILLLALGGVFVGTSVMAHENADDNSHTDTDADGNLVNAPTADHVLGDHPTVTVGATGADAEPATSITFGGTTYVLARVATTRLMDPDSAVYPAVTAATFRITFSEDVLYEAPTTVDGLFTSDGGTLGRSTHRQNRC